MRLHAVGGLCNRLRAILSYRDVHGRLTVVWEPDEYVSYARFLEVFAPLGGVTFVDSGGWDKEDFAPCLGARSDWKRAYAELEMVPSLQSEYDRGIPMLGGVGNYPAIHVRRTDHVPDVDTHRGQMTPLGDFLRWGASWNQLFVATDNGETQRTISTSRTARGLRTVFTALHGGEEVQGLTDHRRNGELKSAVLDLFTCANAHSFMGSHGSSFTDTIVAIRALRGLGHG